MVEYFDDWKKKTGTLKELTTSEDAARRTTETWATVKTNVKFATWIDRAIQTNTNDQFSNDEIGKIVIDPDDITTTPTNKMRMDVGNDIYYIEGVDDIGGFGEVWLLSYRKQRK